MKNHVHALMLGLTFSFLATQGSFAFSKPDDAAKKVEANTSTNSDEITYMTIVKFNPNTGDTTTSVIEPDSMDESTKTKIMAHANMVSGDGKKPAGGAATLGAFDSFLRKAGRVVNTAVAGGDWKKTAGEQFSKALGDISKAQSGGNKTMPVVEKPVPAPARAPAPAPTPVATPAPVTAPLPAPAPAAAQLPPPPPPATPNTGSVSAPAQLPPPPPPMAGAQTAPAAPVVVSTPAVLPPPPPPMASPSAPAISGGSKAPSGLLNQIQQGAKLKPVEGNLTGNKRPRDEGNLASSLADQIAKRAKSMNPDAPQPMDVDPDSDWE